MAHGYMDRRVQAAIVDFMRFVVYMSAAFLFVYASTSYFFFGADEADIGLVQAGQGESPDGRTELAAAKSGEVQRPDGVVEEEEEELQLGMPPAQARSVFEGNRERLEARSWHLPMPNGAEDFATKHGCKVPKTEQAVAVGYSSEDSEELQAERRRLQDLVFTSSGGARDPVIVSVVRLPRVTTDGKSFRTLLRGFACMMRRLEIKPLIFGSSAKDAEEVSRSFPPLVGVHLPALNRQVMKLLLDKNGAADVSPYLLKWPCVLATLQVGAPAVLFTDIDVLWYRDPRVYLMGLAATSDFAAALDSQLETLDSLRKKSWLPRIEQIGAEEDVSPCCRGGFQLNAGQVLLANSAGARALLLKAVATHRAFIAKTEDKNRCIEDQDPLQWAAYLHCMDTPDRCRVLDPALFRDYEGGLLLERAGEEAFSVHADVGAKVRAIAKLMNGTGHSCIDSFAKDDL